MVWRCLCISWYLLLSCASTSHSFFSFLPCCYHVDFLPQIDQALNKFFFVHSRSHIAMIWHLLIQIYQLLHLCNLNSELLPYEPLYSVVNVIIVVVYCHKHLAEHFKSWNLQENTTWIYPHPYFYQNAQTVKMLIKIIVVIYRHCSDILHFLILFIFQT